MSVLFALDLPGGLSYLGGLSFVPCMQLRSSVHLWEPHRQVDPYSSRGKKGNYENPKDVWTANLPQIKKKVKKTRVSKEHSGGRGFRAGTRVGRRKCLSYL